MKNLVFIAATGVLLTLVMFGYKVVIEQAQIKQKQQLELTGSKEVYDQGVIEASGYCKLKNQVIPIKSADIFLNEEFVQIVMQPEDQDMQPLMFTTQSSKWTSNIFKDSFTTVVVTDKTVVLKSELNNGTLISLKR